MGMLDAVARCSIPGGPLESIEEVDEGAWEEHVGECRGVV